ncbi:Ribose-5-phosphate isomerase A [Quillaja saponaria]|uniref:Ribose-5-phosphate isomerase A n=1 Tax=Quillaja saponaria TaxID=32244 RepID=A0AAD7PFB6_QUISA|nr:Ribose-5-phosphate isomerase A [Quillaja saponaria]
MGELNNGCYSSSEEEDGGAEWRAAIDSVAGTSSYISSFMNGFSATANGQSAAKLEADDDREHNPKTQQLKHYQVKAQKLLDDILEKTLDIVKDPTNALNEDPKMNEGGIRLFKNAPPGIVFDHRDELQGPTRRPRILPGEEIDEKSKKYKRQIHSIAVDGEDIITAARAACQKSLARLEAKDSSAKAAAKKEAERVEKLKKVRGERWLPSIAKEMQVKSLGTLVRTLWGLQERRWSSTYEVVQSLAVSMTMSFLLCFLSIHGHRRGDTGFGSI